MFYKFPKRIESENRYKHHEQVLPRIIGDNKARVQASTYIYRAPFKEKMVITKMLNDWNQPDLDSTKESNEVIRPKAANVIKDWLTNAKDGEAVVAEKFLSHLKKGRGTGERRAVKSATFRRVFQRETPRVGGNPEDTPRCENDIDRITKKRKEWRPQTAKPLTNGTFYPHIGYGNNTGVFNIIPASPRTRPCSPTPPPSLPPPKSSPQPNPSPNEERPSHRPRREETITYYPPPVNRSCIFSAVSLPTERHYQYSQPNIENRSRFGDTSRSSRAGDAADQISRDVESLRIYSQGGEQSATASRPSSKLKFSANMQHEETRSTKGTENVTAKEIDVEKLDLPEKAEIAEEQTFNEQVHFASERNSPIMQLKSGECRCRCRSKQSLSPDEKYFLPRLSASYRVLGYNDQTDMVGSAGRRRHPGRQYDKHFTLG